MSNSPNLNQSCGSVPPSSSGFQSTLSDMLDKMDAGQKCKQTAESMFDSGSSSSGSNMQSGSSSSSTDSSVKTGTTSNATSVYVNAPFNLGGAGANNVYTTGSTDSSLSTDQQSTQLNLTKQEAEAFNKGASKMSADGCGTVIINAAKISNIKQKMNCLIQQNMTSSTVTASANASIIIRQIPYDRENRMVVEILNNASLDSQTKKDIIKGVLALKAVQANSLIDLSGANLRQTVTLDIKNKLELSSSARTELASMQQEIANAVVESKLTSENKLDALPQSAKDISATDKTITDNCSNTTINQKVNSVKIEAAVGGSVLIETVGSFIGKNMVIDQNIMASVVSEVLVADAIQTGISAAANISDSFEKINKTDLKTVGQDLAAIAATNAAANTAAITAGSAGVTSAAQNQVAVDAGKLAAGNAAMSRANNEGIAAQGEAASKIIKETGDAAAKGADAVGKASAAMTKAQQGDWSGLFMLIGAVVFILALAGAVTAYFKSKSKPSPPSA